MTVLMFGWEFPPHISGGLGTACYGMSKALIERGVSLLFVVPRAYGDEEIPLVNASDVVIQAEELSIADVEGKRIAGTRVISIPSTIKPYSTGEGSQTIEEWNWQFAEKGADVRTEKGSRYLFSGKYGPSLMEEVYRYSEVAGVLARELEYDIIHAHDWLTYLAGMEAKRVSGKPLIVHVHATEFDRAGDGIDQRVFEIERLGMVNADRVVAVSQWTKDIIVDKYGINPGKISVVYNGVHSAEETDVGSIPKISDRVVTFLGRITYQKGPRYFLDAARRVLDYYPDTHFIMAGSGDLLPAMLDEVARYKLSSRIHFTGFLKGKQVQQIWSVTDVYVMPSVSEPFGITPLEAVRAGVPVIVSNQSGVSEVINHALKVDFWDSNALANAIINVLRHKGLANTLKVNGEKEVAALTWSSAAKKIDDIYHEF